jgi:ABC-type uncharacterized transport system involved in gliding motility auxiliary subunit
MNAGFLKARQTQYAAYLTVYVLIVIAILAVANILSNRYNKSFDTTSNKRYSLSPQTAKIVKELKQPATITYYDQSNRFEQGKDLLEQYAALSPKLKIEYVDPDKKPQLATAAGVKNYGTAIVEIGAKKEEAKGFTEEGITGAFIRVLKNNTRTVCFVQGNGEHRIDDSDRSGYSRLKDLLAKDNYETKSIDLLQKAEIPQECTALVVGGPHTDYADPQVGAIKTYVENGGRALFLLDPPLKIGRAEVADNDALDKVLADWGVTPEKNLILDMNPIGQISGLGPQVALVTSYDSHPIVNEMKGSATGFPLSRSLDVKNGAKTTVEKLFETSGTSLATAKLNSPEVDVNDPKNVKGPLTIAAAGMYNTGKENSQGRFVVVGSSDWAANSFLPFNGNRDLALNAMNWLSSDEDLISIRPKDRDDRRITLTVSQMAGVRNTSLIFFPLVVIVMGISVWWRRR